MRNRASFTLCAILVCIAVLSMARPASAQCILDPNSAGQNGQTRLQNFYTLVDDLYRGEVDPDYDFKPTHRIFLNGKHLQAPPWYDSSTECEQTNLKSGYGAPSPSRTLYLLVSDELSELAIVTALANNDRRMMEIHNTIQAMESTAYPGLPCWVAKVDVSANSISCQDQDTATDATARFGLAYYYAANNPNFPTSSQAIYRAAGDALAAGHLKEEYAPGCHGSPVTGEDLCEWVGGGGNTASHQVSDLVMWIGYHQDIVRFLLAAYESTRNPAYAERAEEVVDQWLIASTFDGVNLTFGRYNFKWNTAATPIAPQPGDSWYWQEGRAWDVSDAPRALWMGDVLRAVSLGTDGAPLLGAYAKLSQWVQLVLSNGTQTATISCVQYNQNGSAVAGNCGTDYYYNGLGAGLHTYYGTTTLDDKLDRALVQYGWSGGKTWNSAACFGIYRGIRPVKALAASIGLDSTTYGGTSCLATPASHTLTVSKTGSGSGTVTSTPAGIDCGSDCSEVYGTGTAVTLTASPAAGSSFAGWSGACSGTGGCQVTMDAAKSVTAGFDASGSIPAAPTWLRVDTVSQTELKLTWEDKSSDEAGFKVERKEGCCGPWTLLPDAPANSTNTATYQSSGLKCGTSYAYRVWAYSPAGESAKTNEAARTTSACN